MNPVEMFALPGDEESISLGMGGPRGQGLLPLEHLKPRFCQHLVPTSSAPLARQDVLVQMSWLSASVDSRTPSNADFPSCPHW